MRIQHPAGVAMNCMQASPAQTHPAGNRTMETKRRPALHRSSPPDTLQGTVLWKPSVGQPYTGPHPRTPCREPCYGNQAQASPTQVLTLGHPAGNRTMETKRRPALHRSSPPDTLQGTVLWKPSVGQPYTGPHPRTPCREPCYGNQAQASPTQVLTLGHPAGNRTMETNRRPAQQRPPPPEPQQGTMPRKPAVYESVRNGHANRYL